MRVWRDWPGYDWPGYDWPGYDWFGHDWLGVSTLWRRYRQDLRDLAVRHARERAAFTAWVIEVDHRLIHGEDTIIPNSRRPVLPGNRTED